MKCKTCGNELEIRKANNEKLAICHSCKTKRRLKKKATSPTYSNIPDKAIRQKAERDVKENYAQMLDAGTSEADQKSSPVLKIIVTLLILALLAGAAWFFTPLIKETFFSENVNPQETIRTADSINVDTKQFSIAYDRHEVSTDVNGQSALLVYYYFTNKQKDISISALSTVELKVTQNNALCSLAIMQTETPEMLNMTVPIAYEDSLLVCQAFSLTDTLEAVAEVSRLLPSSSEILGKETLIL